MIWRSGQDLAQWTRWRNIQRCTLIGGVQLRVVVGDGAVLSMLHVRGADGVDVGIGLAPSWKGTLYGTPL
jgi:hypothetical protein